MTTNAQDAADVLAAMRRYNSNPQQTVALDLAIRALRAGGEAVAWHIEYPEGDVEITLHESDAATAKRRHSAVARPLVYGAAAPPAGQPELAELDRAATLDTGLDESEPKQGDELRVGVYWSAHYRMWRCESTDMSVQAFDATVRECVTDWLDKRYPLTTPAPAGDAMANEWKEAILDELAATCQDAPITESPRDILRRVIEWNVDVALDPAVSSRAAALQSSGVSGPPAADGMVNEADELLRGMGLDAARFRTEGGALNAGKVRAALLHPASYAGLYLPKTEKGE